jgi:vacuolar protein sorting-associated protein 11
MEQVTTVALSTSLAHLAIGLADGTVLLYRHLDQSLASSTSLTALPKTRTVHESPAEPITGLGFKEVSEENPGMALFVVTTNHVLAYQITGRGSGGTATVVDEIGCALGCAIMNWRAESIVVARDEAIYLCGPEGRGTCYAYEGMSIWFIHPILLIHSREGHKSSVHTHLNYLVIVSPPLIPSALQSSATVRNFAARTNPGDTDITKVVVFELENKYVAYSGIFTHDVREIVSQWGQIYVLTGDGNVRTYYHSFKNTRSRSYFDFSCYVWKRSRHQKSLTCCTASLFTG